MIIPSRRIAVTATCLLLVALLATVAAADLSVQEANLTPGGLVYEVNRGPADMLYLSDPISREIWRVDPASGAYTVYQGITPQDARADASGNIWWTDGAEIFGRINTQTGARTTWAAGTAGNVNLWGVAIDDSNNVWFSEWFGSSSKLFRFNRLTGELCSFSPSGGTSSYYLVVDGSQVWLGSWAGDKVMRLDAATNRLRTWQLEGDSNPAGMLLDDSGNLWWADAPAGVPRRPSLPQPVLPKATTAVGTLARLEPGLNRLTSYSLPAGTNPQWVALEGSTVWYTESSSGTGTVGNLNPAEASGTVSTLPASDQTLTPSCSTPSGSSGTATTRSGTLAYTPGTWSTIVNSGGWTVYQMPGGASPFGLASSMGIQWIGDQGRQKLAKTSAPACYPFDVHPPPPDCDGDVDIADVLTVAGCFNQPIGTPQCPDYLDFDNSMQIDVADIISVAQEWGWQQ
ncbi:MAG: hypothetical protein U9R25_11795 [Chloroflexota bacterium]|nr:hypothetical protein [Chloroflexota bacterium]